MDPTLRPLFAKFLTFNWKFGLLLVLCVCIPRFLLVLQANQNGNYSSIGIIMFASVLVPFIFLGRSGRKKIGIVRPNRLSVLLFALLLGVVLSFIMYFLGKWLYDATPQNWYVYIGRSYLIPPEISSSDRLIMFIIMAITGMTFSPIGEEFFFRGVVHSSFSESFDPKIASIVDSGTFAIVHLSHFGWVFIDGTWQLFPVPAVLWVICMFLTGWVFIALKRRSGSLWTAVVCHSGFNLGMIYCIFYLL